MTDVMPSLFIDVHPSKAKLTLFFDRNCFLSASTVSVNALQQMLLSVLSAGSANSRRNALYDRRSSRFEIAFHGIWDETNPNMK